MPMIGLIPAARALDQNSWAPNTLPWSVIAIESMPSSAVRSNMSVSRAAPSSMEYSVCTWRCANPSLEPVDMRAFSTPSRRVVSRARRTAGESRGGRSPGEEPSAYVSLAGQSDRTRRVSQPADRAPVAVRPGDRGAVAGEHEPGRDPGLGCLDTGHDAGRLVGDPVAVSGRHVATHRIREVLPLF